MLGMLVASDAFHVLIRFEFGSAFSLRACGGGCNDDIQLPVLVDSDEDNNNTGYSDEDDNLNEEDVGGAENTESPDRKSHMIVDDNLHNGEGR